MAVSTSITLKFNGTQVAKGLAMVRKSFAGLGTAGVRAGRMMLAPFAKLMATMAPLLGFAAIAKIGTDSLKAASDMETLQVQFGALLKSESAATDLIAKLRKLNVESPLGVEDFAQGAKQLLGVQMTADETTDALDKLSNISMGKAENFESLVRAFGQVKSAGRLMGQEVLQFVNAGFNPLTQISLQTGESMATLKKRMEDGKISFQEVAGAIRYATAAGGLFNGMNEKVAATTEGKIQKLKDSWTQLLIAFGTPINDELRPLIDKLTDKFSTLTEKAKKMGTQVGEALTVSFNAFQSGDLGKLIKDAFMAAVTSAGEYLIGVMAYVGNMLNNKLKEFGKELYKLSLSTPQAKAAYAAGLVTKEDIQNGAKIFKPSELSLEDALNTSKGMLQSDIYRGALNKTMDRNRIPSPEGFRYAREGEMSRYSDSQGNMLIKISDSLKSIDQKLTPQF